MATAENAGSSSSKLWAVPSKEWVIPAKPKPGRKPKKDTNPSVNEVEGDPGTRRNSNRAAQRAFRERKQSQLAELQARLQVYEQGEVERSVALQTIARRYKEENEQLRADNAALLQRVAQLEAEKFAAVAAPYQPRKRAAVVEDTVIAQPSKRARTFTEPIALPPIIPTSYPSSPSSTSSMESYQSPTFEVHPVQYRATPSETPFPIYPAEGGGPVKTSTIEDADSPFEKFDCGFCNENIPCVCREILQQHIADRIGGPSQSTVGVDHVEVPVIASSPTSQVRYSMLDNLPVYQPPVPLRRRGLHNQTTRRNSVFPVAQPSPPPTCTGDPRNCGACASDDFGKAFCDAVNDSMAASEVTGTMDFPEDPVHGSPANVVPEVRAMVPCNEAWRQIKSHPNVEFSDLRLLAEVVARRSKCTGPNVVILPPLGSLTPERVDSPVVTAGGPARSPTPPAGTWGARDGTVERKNRGVGVREVPMEALHAALDLLDAKRTLSRSQPTS